MCMCMCIVLLCSVCMCVYVRMHGTFICIKAVCLHVRQRTRTIYRPWRFITSSVSLRSVSSAHLHIRRAWGRSTSSTSGTAAKHKNGSTARSCQGRAVRGAANAAAAAAEESLLPCLEEGGIPVLVPIYGRQVKVGREEPPLMNSLSVGALLSWCFQIFLLSVVQGPPELGIIVASLGSIAGKSGQTWQEWKVKKKNTAPHTGQCAMIWVQRHKKCCRLLFFAAA